MRSNKMPFQRMQWEEFGGEVGPNTSRNARVRLGLGGIV